MGKMIKRQVYYFDESRERNTKSVIQAVSKQLEAGGVTGIGIARPLAKEW